MNLSIKCIFLACLIFSSHLIYAQLNTEIIRSAVAENSYFLYTDSKQWKAIEKFYVVNNFQPAWLNKENTENAQILLDQLQSCADIGLKEDDYDPAFLKSFKNKTVPLKNTSDSVKTEIRLTGIALHFYNDILSGNITPAITYKVVNATVSSYDIPTLLSQYLYKKQLAKLYLGISPNLSETTILQQKIKWFIAITNIKDFTEIVITSDKVSATNFPLIKKLYQLGIIEESTYTLADSIILKKVKQAQKQFGLLADGKLRSTALAAFNVPIFERLQALNLSINYYRWLADYALNKSVIVVNIPAAYLKVYNQNKILLEMRVIVGKKSTPTPTLLSAVNEVVLYPYWHVPYSIATKEILPKLKRSPSVIDKENYQVLNKVGKIVNPYSVPWRSLSTKYFPYTIRQSTGCDNALGLLKFNFNSPGGVYLHDTPNKNFFSFNKRFLSHGCMRMENPTALGHLVLKNNQIAIDTLTQKGCLLNQAPIFVKVIDAMPVLVWYNPAGVDTAGNVLFFEDIYEKFNWRKKQ